MTQPKISIIIPVYNVEPYLRQCLDSVVNQTMRDIQIICVNDGSTDGSRAILQEYADRDLRFEIIDQENQGGGSARNAAYPHIKGKYTYFADPDDWLELDLCQQCWDKAETTNVDFVVLQHVANNGNQCYPPFNPLLPKIRQTTEEKRELLIMTATWIRFWRSDFLLSNNIKFSEGKRPCNDNLAAWKGTVLANRIAILDSQLYHYRYRSGSYQQNFGKTHFIAVKLYKEIGKMLREVGCYETYKEYFFTDKLHHCYFVHNKLPCSLRPQFLQHMHRHWTKTDREYCQNTLLLHLPRYVRHFYLSLGFAGQLGMQRYQSELLSDILSRLDQKNQKKGLLFPHWLGHFISCFIPKKKNRQRFRAKHVRGK